MKGFIAACWLALLPVAVGAIGVQASVSPAGKNGFLYTNNNPTGANTVSAYSVAADGALVPLAGSPYSTGGTADGAGLYSTNRIAVSPTGSLLYVGNEGSRNVSVFSINRLTGELSLVMGSPFATATSMTGELGLVATPDNRFLMVTNGVSNQIAIFSVAGNGSLAAIAGSPFALGGKPGGMRITPDGKFLAMSYVLSNRVAVFAIAADGTLTGVPGSPFALHESGAGDMGTGLEIDCSGKLLFVDQVVPGGNSAVDVFAIASNGALSRTAGSPFQAGAGLNSNVILLSRDGHKLFLSNQGGKAVTVFEVAADGVLATISGSPFAIAQGPAAPTGMASVAAGNYLYTANNDSSITAFSVAGSGALSLVGTASTGQTLGLQSLVAYPPKPCSNAVPHVQQPLIPEAIAHGGR